jgi:hypothetical protein
MFTAVYLGINPMLARLAKEKYDVSPGAAKIFGT